MDISKSDKRNYLVKKTQKNFQLFTCHCLSNNTIDGLNKFAY